MSNYDINKKIMGKRSFQKCQRVNIISKREVAIKEITWSIK